MSVRSTAATKHVWSSEQLPGAVTRSLDRLAHLADVRYIAIMPDAHLAREVCVGTVLATTQLLYPAAVGTDIGCGMTAVAVDATSNLVSTAAQADQLLSALRKCVPSNRHSRRTAPAALPADLLGAPLSDPRLEKQKQRDGRVQYGTLGRGNHFVELQRDPSDRLWLLVHCGSRGMGQAITAHHLSRSGASRQPLVALDGDSDAGCQYLQDVRWAIRYARSGRRAILTAVESVLSDLFGVSLLPETLIDTHHNHLQRETHFGGEFWVHRKGALSAHDGQSGIIAGSMATPSFHVEGRGNPESLCSSSHGAGRRWSRHEARKRVTRQKLAREMSSVWFEPHRCQSLCDEAPSAYKDIRGVMRAQKDLTRIMRELQPLLVYKG